MKFESVRRSRHKNSRYRNLYRFVDREGKKVIETYEKLHIQEHPDDVYHKVQPGEEHFLDMIAYNYYKSEGLWWVIAEANNLFDPFFIPTGMVLRVPSINNLRGFRGILS